MLITVDAAAAEPLYLQIRNQIVAGIATGQLEPGQSLPSVRSLASDLGINLHTVNKAYAVLRDEGYVRMRGRAGAVIADPAAADRADRVGTIELALVETPETATAESYHEVPAPAGAKIGSLIPVKIG